MNVKGIFSYNYEVLFVFFHLYFEVVAMLLSSLLLFVCLFYSYFLFFPHLMFHYKSLWENKRRFLIH